MFKVLLCIRLLVDFAFWYVIPFCNTEISATRERKKVGLHKEKICKYERSEEFYHTTFANVNPQFTCQNFNVEYIGIFY